MAVASSSRNLHKIVALPYAALFVALAVFIGMFVVTTELNAFWMVVGVMGAVIVLDLILDLRYGTTPLRISFWKKS